MTASVSSCARWFVVVEVVLAQNASPGYLCWIWIHQLAWRVCVCVLVPCAKRSVLILFINSLCCYGSAFPQASSVRGKLRHSCHITLSLSSLCPTHTRTRTRTLTEIQTPRPNSWYKWHNTAVSQNNSTLQLNMEESWSCLSMFRSEAGPGSMWSAVTLHTATTCSSKLLLTSSVCSKSTQRFIQG